VALLNTGRRTIRVATTAAAIGIKRAVRYKVENAWNGRTSTVADTIGARVAPDSALLYLVTGARR
jgi:hypothetical protein